MYKGPIKNHFIAAGAALTPEALDRALNLAGLTWGMPPAQIFATHCWYLQNPAMVVVHEKADETIVKTEFPAITMFGLPVEIDRDLPLSTVQLRYQGAVLYEIQGLAIPIGFED